MAEYRALPASGMPPAKRLSDALESGVGFFLGRADQLYRLEPVPDLDPIGAAWWQMQRWGRGEEEAFRRHLVTRLKDEPTRTLVGAQLIDHDGDVAPLSPDAIVQALQHSEWSA